MDDAVELRARLAAMETELQAQSRELQATKSALALATSTSPPCVQAPSSPLISDLLHRDDLGEDGPDARRAQQCLVSAIRGAMDNHDAYLRTEALAERVHADAARCKAAINTCRQKALREVHGACDMLLHKVEALEARMVQQIDQSAHELRKLRVGLSQAEQISQVALSSGDLGAFRKVQERLTSAV